MFIAAVAAAIGENIYEVNGKYYKHLLYIHLYVFHLLLNFASVQLFKSFSLH